MLIYILCGLCIVIFSFCIHELGHVLGIRLAGGHVRGVFLPFIIIYKEEKWKIKLKKFTPKSHVLMDLEWIKDEEDYCNIRKKLIKELYYGPIISIIFLAMQIIAGVIYFVYNHGKITDAAVVFAISILVNIEIVINCFKNDEGKICDMYAVNQIKNKEMYFQSYVIEYLMLASDSQTKIKESHFFISKIEDVISNRTSDNTINDEDFLYILYDYLTLVVAGYIPQSEIITKKILAIESKIKEMYNKENTFIVILFMRIAQYLYISGNGKEAYLIYQHYISDNYSVSDVAVYYDYQTRTILEIEDCTTYLKNTRNIRNSLINQEYMVFDSTLQLYRDILKKKGK